MRRKFYVTNTMIVSAAIENERKLYQHVKHKTRFEIRDSMRAVALSTLHSLHMLAWAGFPKSQPINRLKSLSGFPDFIWLSKQFDRDKIRGCKKNVTTFQVTNHLPHLLSRGFGALNQLKTELRAPYFFFIQQPHRITSMSPPPH